MLWTSFRKPGGAHLLTCFHDSASLPLFLKSFTGRRVLGDSAKIRTQYITPSHGHLVGQDAGVVARCILVPALGAGFDDREEVSCYTWYSKEASVFQARVAYEEKSKSLFKFTQHGIRTVVL